MPPNKKAHATMGQTRSLLRLLVYILRPGTDAVADDAAARDAAAAATEAVHMSSEADVERCRKDFHHLLRTKTDRDP